MSSDILGFSVIMHRRDGSTEVVTKFGPDTMAAAMAKIGGFGGGRGGKYQRVEEAGCPEHGEWKFVPGGISKKTGKAYEPFVTCHDDECTYRPTTKVEKALIAGRNDASQVAPEPSGTPANVASDYDDLPF